MKKASLIILILFSFVQSKAQTTWKLVWSDEFDSTAINTSNWNHEVNGNGGGNNELQYYTARPENSLTENGRLEIIARQESYSGKSYTSARMTTQGKQSFTYGKIEAKIKLPLGKGLWPAFWMLGESISTAGWPACGEIDIMEHVNTENKTYGTIHWDNNGHAQYGGNTTTDFSLYHVYSIEWNDSTINWLLDGTQFFSANILNNINSTNEFHAPQFILLNMAVGGSWPGNPDNTTPFPDTMFVDYVRVYQLQATPTPITVSVSTSNGDSICPSGTTTLTASGATNYTWSPAEGLSATTGTSVIATPTVTTTYTVIGEDSGSADTATQVVTIRNIDDATFSYAINSFCVSGNDTPSKATSGGSFIISPTSNLSIDAGTGQIDITNTTNVGHYDITYTTNGICPNSSTVGIEVKDLSDASFAYASSSYCNNETSNPVIIQSLNAVAGIFSSSPSGLYFVSNFTGEINLATSAPITYTITNTIAAGGGCPQAIATASVTINASPAVSATSSTICSGTQITLAAAGATTYSWSTTPIQTGNSITVTPNLPTSYTVTGTTAGCTGSAVANVVVNPLPIITVNSETICIGTQGTLTASGAPQYVWQNGTISATITDSPSTPTTYTVIGTDVNGCSSHTTGTIYVVTDTSICSDNIVGVQNNQNSTPFSLSQNYPNPFSTSTNILFSIAEKVFTTLTVIDPMGREISSLISETLPAGKFAVQWNAGAFESGVYFYRLQAGEHSATRKLFLFK
jgi:beta-glucanase (GH16 family)